ncbi:MAG: M15 family metallopeptidase [Alphaproteobacteria bacterium]|nr:M15 family metallopeptidase [Alphaproteobacteria bacterium]
MTIWPTQAGADGFYGNPRGRNGGPSWLWEVKSLVHLTPPFAMHYGGQPVSSFRIHRACAASLGRVLAAIHDAAGRDQATLDAWGVSTFGGSYNFRLKRNSNTLSMHAYGCALDLAPERFPMGRSKPTFCAPVLKAFADEGWVNLEHDRMHFQAARL